MFSKPLKFTSFLVCVLFFWTLAGGSPLANATKVAADQKGPERAAPRAGVDKLNRVLDRVADLLEDGELAGLDEAITPLTDIDTEIQHEFAATKERLEKAKLPTSIIKRHTDFVATYNKNLTELKKNLTDIKRATGAEAKAAAIGKAKKHLAKRKGPKKLPSFDPNNLPHRSMKPIKQQPKQTKEEYQKAYPKPEKKRKTVKVAASGDYALDMLAQVIAENQTTTTEDELLAETPEVQLTDSIKAKAAELDHDPLKIYLWVYDNVEFVPTWGSIQGAQLCLETKQGNALDISSLLLALFRASGVKSRYVMGTAEVSIDRLMNWAGGFTDPFAAIDHMAAGGIPTTGITKGDKIVSVQFEHIWIEAFIDYFPSWGARHKNEGADTWIPIDAAFKQYSYTEGVDIAASVPFDTDAFVSELTNSATINEEMGYVTGIDQEYIAQAMESYKTQAENYITQNHSEATVGEIIGSKTIHPEIGEYFGAGLQYKTVVNGGKYTTLPASLRHRLSFEVAGNNSIDSPLSYSTSLPQLAGKKITLGYKPATQADEDAINAYLPEPHADGTPIQPEELPSSLPAYLINLIPELRVDGAVVATGQVTGLGETNNFTMTFSSPWITADKVENSITAGTYHAIALDLGRVSAEQMERLQSDIESIKTRLESGNYANLESGTIIGDLLYSVALSYHAQLGVTKYLNAKAANVAASTWPSETIFATNLSVARSFGVPTRVGTGELVMDADKLVTVSTARDGDNQKKVSFMLQTGMTSSALEHSVPEQLLSTEENPAEGVSAVKAIQLAAEQGIPIYTVTKANVDTVLPQLQFDSEFKSVILNVVESGKIVTVPKTDINFNGWIGVGYMAVDPETGAGAYIIGGLSGASLVGALRDTFFSTLAWEWAWHNMKEYWGNVHDEVSAGIDKRNKFWMKYFNNELPPEVTANVQDHLLMFLDVIFLGIGGIIYLILWPLIFITGKWIRSERETQA